MVSNGTDFVTDDFNHAPEVFFCPTKPVFTWILSDTTTFQATVSISCIACPITVLLNILVITSVKKRKKLQTNSNTLLVNLAAADLLVGALSMPMTITLDALLLQKAVGHWICRLAYANQLVLYAAVCSSLCNMTLIAWERYVAIGKWNHYKGIVTRKRMTRCAGIAWLLALLTTTPVRIFKALGLDYKYTKILDTILFLPALICLLLIGYFYFMVNLNASRYKQRINRARSRVRAKMTTSIANTTAILALALLISYVPAIVILFLGEKVPFLRTSSFFRWSEVLTQLNSLVNPLLYCFVPNSNFRREAVKMLKMRASDETQPLNRVQRLRTWWVSTITRQDIQDTHEFKEQELEDCFDIPESPDFVTLGGADYCKSRRAVVEESSSCPAVVNHITMVDVHQLKPVKFKTSVKVSGSAMNMEDQAQGTRSQCRCFQRYHRDKSCDEKDVKDKTEKPDPLEPSPNSKQPKSISLQQELEAASSVIDRRNRADGTSGETQCSLYHFHQENGNKNAVVELISGQTKTTQGPKKTALSPGSYAAKREETGLILSFPDLQQSCKDGPTRETAL